MDKKITAKNFEEVDGENLTFEERIEELAEGLTSKDTFIIDGQKFKNTKQGKRQLQTYLINNCSKISDLAIIRVVALMLFAVICGWATYSNINEGSALFTMLFGVLTLVFIYLALKCLHR